MSRRTTRAAALTTGALTASTFAWLGLLADPALACSCGQRDMDASLVAGHSLVIVTRVDKGVDENATFRVEDSVGPEPPQQLEGTMDTGASCQPYVAPGQVAALIYERREGQWHLGSCSSVPLGPALQKAQGAPVAVDGGPAEVLVAGAFGGARVAMLDRAGNPIAWDGTAGEGDKVAVCPGGDTVVAVGRTVPTKVTEERHELTVHDADTLRVRRTVRLELRSSERIAALRCSDDDTAEVLTYGYPGDGGGRLLRVVDAQVSPVEPGMVLDGVALRDGFLAVVGEKNPELVRVSATGERLKVIPLRDVHSAGSLAVSPDERTAALRAYQKPHGEVLLTHDLTSGDELGRHTQDELYITGMDWTAPDELVVRHEVGYHKTPITPLVFDRNAERTGQWAPVTDEWGGRFSALGSDILTYRGVRLQVTPRTGDGYTVPHLRLAAVSDLVGLTEDAELAAPTAPAEPEPSGGVVTAIEDDSDGMDGRVLGAVGAGTAIAAAGVFGLYRRRS